MVIDLHRIDTDLDHASLRISFDSADQCYYVHRDYRGPYNTLARICLLRLSDRDLAMSNSARRCFDALKAACNAYGGGILRVRYNEYVRSLLLTIAENLEFGDRNLCPSPTNPVLPDTDAMIAAAPAPRLRPEIGEYAAVLQSLDTDI